MIIPPSQEFLDEVERGRDWDVAALFAARMTAAWQLPTPTSAHALELFDGFGAPVECKPCPPSALLVHCDPGDES